MKKILKSFAALSLGLALVAAGCSSDDDDKSNNLSSVIGNYPILVEIPALGLEDATGLPTTLVVTQNGSDLKATASVTVPAAINPLIGTLTINLTLTSVTEYSLESAQFAGYTFKIAQQDISVLGSAIPFKGTGEYGNSYDGIIGKYMSAIPVIAFDIVSVNEIPLVGFMTISVSSTLG